MTDNIDEVRKRFDAPEDVEPAEGLTAPDEAGAPPRTPDMDTPPPPADDEHDKVLQRALRLPLNDYGNGQRVVLHFGQDMMFVPRVGWFTWTGTHWKIDPDEIAIRRKAQSIAELIGQEVKHICLPDWEMEIIGSEDGLAEDLDAITAVKPEDRSDEQKRRMAQLKTQLAFAASLREKLGKIQDRRRTHARNAGNSGPLKNMLLESTTTLATDLSELDSDPLMVNTESGALKFSVAVEDDAEMREQGCSGDRVASVEVLEHDRADRLTKIMPVRYDPEATAQKFDAFMRFIQPDPEMRDFLQRSFGLGLSGLVVQNIWFFHGSGANGKSVLMEVIARIMSEYAATAKIESLLERNKRNGGDATPDLIPLVNARLVRTSEPNQGDKLDEGKVKELTGGEPIKVRSLHNDFFDFDPQFKLFVSGNYKPDIHGDDHGIWRRVLLVPFTVQIPDEQQREFNEVVEEFLEEKEGIFNWLVQGLLAYLENGLQVPDAVMNATKEYKEESDMAGTFLARCCVCTGDPSDIITSRDLGHAFQFWMDSDGKGTWKSIQTVQKRLAKKCGEYVDARTGRGFEKGKASVMRYEGIRFNDEFNSRFRDAVRDKDGRPIVNSAWQSPDP